MDVFDVIQKRFSVRSYQDKPVEQEKLNIILEAAQSAPTACNLQSFKIIVAKTEGRRELLKKIYHQNWFADAPYVIGVCAIKDKCWVRKDKSYADVDAAIVMIILFWQPLRWALALVGLEPLILSHLKKLLKLKRVWNQLF